MGKMSRDKGNRFERFIADKFSNGLNRKIRRVPLSGGIEVRSDLYDPEDDSFPLFIECKNRKTHRINSLFSGSSELYQQFRVAEKSMIESYIHKKYIMGPEVILIFQGGDFKEPYVMIDSHTMRKLNILFQYNYLSINMLNITYGKFFIFKLENSFINACKMIPNLVERNSFKKLKAGIHDDDEDV